MAVVLAPLHSVQVRGQLGDKVFRRWRSLNTISQAAPAGPGPQDNASWLAWKDTASYWSGLTNEQRAAWNKYGRETEIRAGPLKPDRRSGYIWARMAAFLAGKVGEDPPASPWSGPAPGPIRGLTLGINGAGNWVVAWDSIQEAKYVGMRANLNYPAVLRFYDYKLSEEKFYTSAGGGVEFGEVIPGRKARIAVRLIRENCQTGFIDYREFQS